jgi:hypothetical protein
MAAETNGPCLHVGTWESRMALSKHTHGMQAPLYVDLPFAAVPGDRRSTAPPGALHLAHDGEGAAEEVDVADPDSGSLAEREAGEGVERIVGGLEKVST